MSLRIRLKFVAGPALLFERYMKSSGSRKFFACSTFRDRKQCSFFRWADDVKRKRGPESAQGNKSSENGNQLSHAAYRKR